VRPGGSGSDVVRLYLALVTVHLLAALFWLGGMFFLAAVGAPVLRKVEPPELRAELFRRLGERARGVGWAAIAVLVLSGTWMLHLRGWLDGALWSDARFWRSAPGTALAWKLGAVAAILAVQAVHDFALGPAASRAAPGTPEALRLRRRAAWLGRVSAVVGVVLVVAAVRLARGG
jgi:copper resistance protein D